MNAIVKLSSNSGLYVLFSLGHADTFHYDMTKKRNGRVLDVGFPPPKKTPSRSPRAHPPASGLLVSYS